MPSLATCQTGQGARGKGTRYIRVHVHGGSRSLGALTSAGAGGRAAGVLAHDAAGLVAEPGAIAGVAALAGALEAAAAAVPHQPHAGAAGGRLRRAAARVHAVRAQL